MSEQQNNSFHNLIIENRRKLSVSGVREIEGFTETEVSIYTETGQLTIRGKNLKVEQANIENGNLIMYGNMIDSVVYSEKICHSPNNFITKLFR